MKRALILAAVTAAASSLALTAGAEAELRVGKNYRLNSDSGAYRGKDMVALAVDPSNPQHIVEVNASYLSEDCEGTASFDGGVTWSPADAFDNPPAPNPNPADPATQPFQPPCRISNHLAESMFQTVAFGTGQTVYATYQTPRVTAAGGEQGASTLVVKSTDGGRTWGTAVVAMPGGPVGSGPSPPAGPYYELPTLAVDPGAGPGGADRVYVVAHETTAAGLGVAGDVAVSVSQNGGQSFSAPVTVEPAGEDATEPSQPVIAPDHSVSVAWRQIGKDPATGQNVPQGSVKVARSTDQGQTWGTPVVVAGVTAGGVNSNSHVTPLPSSASTFPRLAVDKGNGNLYLVYNQGPPGPTAPSGGFQGADHFIHLDLDVYFQRSTNGGATWSAPKLINDATPRPGSEVTQTRHPNVSVAPGGRVDITWEDRRHWYQPADPERRCIHTHLLCDEARLGDTYYAYSTDGGNTFTRHRISDRSHNNDVGYDYRFGTGWAFGPVSVPLGNDRVLVGWMDSREGSFDNDTQDIYLARVDLSGSSAVPQERIARSPDAPSLSVELSQHAYPGGGEGLMAATFATRNGTKVVIANQGDVPGILAGGVLARANLSQVLLSPSSGLPASVKAEVSRMNPAGAYVVGDTGSLSNQVVQDLTAAGVPADQVVRLSGAGDAGTAQAIAQNLDRRRDVEKAAHSPAFDAVVIANPASPDASAASALVAARRLPILFVNADSIPQSTKDALSTLDINKTLVIGGSRWVSDAVAGQLPSPTRLGGSDQYETSKAVVAESRERGLPDNIAYVADGATPIDGALLGSAVGRVNGLLLLSRTPLSANAASTAAGMGLTGALDRLILLEPVSGGRQAIPVTPKAGTPRKRARLSLKVRRRGKRRTITLIASGRIREAGRASAAGRCGGNITISVRGARNRRIVRTRTRVRRNCTYRKVIRFSRARMSRRLGRRLARRTRRVRVVARFGGNAFLTPASRAARVRIR